MFSSGDALAQYYVQAFFPIGVTGNVLSFMVGISKYLHQEEAHSLTYILLLICNNPALLSAVEL